MLTFAALFAYALVPAVKLLERVMARFLAILLFYLVVLGALGALLYLIVSTAIVQVISLSDYVRLLLTPGKSGQLTPLEQTLRSLGLSQGQISSARDQVIASIEGFASSGTTLLTGLVGAVLLFLGAEVNAFAMGVRDTPNDLVTMVHMMTRHLPTSEQPVQQGGESRKLAPDSHD